MHLTFGIEEELLLVDAGSGHLAGRAAELLEATQPAPGTSVVAELSRCQVETNSDVCTTLDQAERQLETMRSEVDRAASVLGMRAVALASHPWDPWDEQTVNTDTSHYRALLSEFQQIARETVICGCHVHVGIDDPDDRVRTMGAVAPWLPVLLALSANSPWWQGVDTGYASYRTLVWKSWPTASMPPPLADDAELERLVAALRRVEAIDDPSGLYWYVRPSSKLPTLEYRVADVCLRVEDAVTLAGLTRALTATALRTGAVDHLPPAVLESALWRAARHGLSATLVDPTSADLRPAEEVVGRLLDHVEGALRDAGDLDRVREGVDRILRGGNGAAVQRAVLGAGPAEPTEALEAIVTARSDR